MHKHTEGSSFPGGTSSKESVCQCRRPKRGRSARSPGGGQAAHSSILAQRIPWAEGLTDHGPQHHTTEVTQQAHTLKVQLIIKKKKKRTYLIQLFFHSRYQHYTSYTHSNKQEKRIDQPGYSGVISTRTASAQQTRGAATQTRYLEKEGYKSVQFKGYSEHLHSIYSKKDEVKLIKKRSGS